MPEPIVTPERNGRCATPNAESKHIINVKLVKKLGVGLGFNIAGGSDGPHLADDPGIFVVRIKPEGAAAKDGTLNNGDRIISLNGHSLECVTHEEAVAIFRAQKGHINMVVEQNAETNYYTQRSRNNSGTSVGQASQSNLTIGNVEASSNDAASKLKSVRRESEGVSDSKAPSVASLDDVPSTPKRASMPDSPRRVSHLPQALYFVVGAATVAIVAYFGYRRYSRV